MTEDRRLIWISWLVGVLAIPVVGWQVGVPGLWYDEIVTLTMAERSWPGMFSVLAKIDAVHGLYYSVLHVWVDLVGYSPFLLRLPSVLFVAATSVVLVRLGALLWSPMAGVVAGIAFLGLPRTSWMGSQARSYALAALTITLAAYLFVVAIKDPRTRNWVYFGLAWGLSVCVFVYNALLLLAFCAVILELRSRCVDYAAQFVRAASLALVLSSGIVLLSASQRAQISWIDRTQPRDLLAPYYAFFDGTNTLIGAVGWVSLASMGWVLLFWSSRHRSPHDESVQTRRSALLLVTGWLLVPGMTLLVLGTVWPLYSASYLSISVPALALTVGGGWAVLGRRGAAASVVALAVLAYQPWAFHRSPGAKSDVLQAVFVVRDVTQPGDTILFLEGTGWSTRQLAYAYPQAFEELEDILLAETYEESQTFFGRGRPLLTAVAELEGVHRVAVVANVPDGTSPELDEATRILRDLGFQLVENESTGDWRVLAFED